jgi:hypothetical protein
MSTINDIQFDRDYTHASTHFLLLYHRHLNQPGPPVVVPLSHANLLTFVHHFDNIVECQRHVSTNLAKMITLFVMDDELEFQLLYVGLGYIMTTCDEFREDNGVRDKFMADGKRITDAIGSFFGQKATRSSQEAT